MTLRMKIATCLVVLSMSFAAQAQNELIGRWKIDEWMYQEGGELRAFNGNLQILDLPQEGGLVGELFFRDVKGTARQRVTIRPEGAHIILTGTPLSSSGPNEYAGRTLKLTLAGDAMSGSTLGTAGDGGTLKMRRIDREAFPAACDRHAFFSQERRPRLMTSERLMREIANEKLTAQQALMALQAELQQLEAAQASATNDTQRARAARKLDELRANQPKLESLLNCLQGS